MKRYGNIYAKIYDMDNLRLAHENARKDKLYYKEVKMVEEKDIIAFYTNQDIVYIKCSSRLVDKQLIEAFHDTLIKDNINGALKEDTRIKIGLDEVQAKIKEEDLRKIKGIMSTFESDYSFSK